MGEFSLLFEFYLVHFDEVIVIVFALETEGGGGVV